MSKQEINNKFIDHLRYHYGTIHWALDTTDHTEIVPEELTHDYLLRNFKIDKNIYKHYHLPTSNLLSDSEFQKMKESGFVGNKESALNPYSIIIAGAYYLRSDFTWKLSRILHAIKPYRIEGKEIKYFTDLIPYYKEYAKGFKYGFNEFENKKIKPFLTMFADQKDYANKIFEYITKDLFLIECWSKSLRGFTTDQNNEIVEAYENGELQGNFYRAWSIVFSNNNLFAPLFQEYFKALPPQPITKQKPEITDKLITFNNTEIIDKLFNELKGFFTNNEAELLKVLQGEQLNKKLLFPHNQNKFVELFKRLKYNGFLLNTPKEIENWICLNFSYQFQKGNIKEVRNFNSSTVHDILTKDKGEPTKKERICMLDWLPYKSHLTLHRESESEKL